jgi:membrane-bound metal-dependent hydrolase YbcI (DUF457 family)
MAGFRTHITVSTALGVGVGAAAVHPLGFSTESAILTAGLTAVGGMLPDLDSDSGIPIREMFGLAAVVLPLTLIPRLMHLNISEEAILAVLLFSYLVIRYPVAHLFKYFTVHRGMYHSIPAMLIAGLLMYLGYDTPDQRLRMLLAGGVMAGFLSHLVLDEIYSVDFRGVKIRLKSSAGTAVKFVSPSMKATTCCYAMLGGLGYLAYLDYEQDARPVQTNTTAAITPPPNAAAPSASNLVR